MKAKAFLPLTVIVLIAVLGAAPGCSKAPNDAAISTSIQSSLNSDSGLQGKQLTVESKDGTVTLSGTVDNEVERDAAARYAAAAPGVKQVINNLQVSAPPEESAQAQPAADQTPAPAPAMQAPAAKPSPSRHHRHPQAAAGNDDSSSDSADPSMAQSMAPSQAAEPAAATAPAEAAPAPPPPPPPPPQKVTIPSGTVVAIRLVDPIDSETSQTGQTFHATLDSPLAVDGEVAVPSGYDVEGHVVDVQSAGKFAGKSQLTLQLDRIKVGSHFYNIQTSSYHREGSSRGKNTAEKVGAGSVIGAIIGGIAGGGKGAAIGAAAGGGVGGGVQAATKGQQIKLPSETVINFTLQSPLTVTPTTQGPHRGAQPMDSNQ